jgi:hypothetical protein
MRADTQYLTKIPLAESITYQIYKKITIQVSALTFCSQFEVLHTVSKILEMYQYFLSTLIKGRRNGVGWKERNAGGN